MKYISNRKSKTSNEHIVFSFEMNREEIKFIHNLIQEHYKKIPKEVGYDKVRCRAENLKRALGNALTKYYD